MDRTYRKTAVMALAASREAHGEGNGLGRINTQIGGIDSHD